MFFHPVYRQGWAYTLKLKIEILLWLLFCRCLFAHFTPAVWSFLMLLHLSCLWWVSSFMLFHHFCFQPCIGWSFSLLLKFGNSLRGRRKKGRGRGEGEREKGKGNPLSFFLSSLSPTPYPFRRLLRRLIWQLILRKWVELYLTSWNPLIWLWARF